MEFNWSGTPRFGSCATCGRSELDAGFVDLIGETVARNPVNGDGFVVDLILCANCVKEAARLVGCATPVEVNDLVHQKIADDEEIQKLKDEAAAWQDRFLELVNLTGEDFDRLAQRRADRTLLTPGSDSGSTPPLSAGSA